MGTCEDVRHSLEGKTCTRAHKPLSLRITALDLVVGPEAGDFVVFDLEIYEGSPVNWFLVFVHCEEAFG